MGVQQRSAILRNLEEHHQGEGRHGTMKDDAAIAVDVTLSVDIVRDELEILELQQKVQLAKTFEGMSALITPTGRLAVEGL